MHTANTLTDRQLGLAIELINFGVKSPRVSAMAMIHPKVARKLFKEHTDGRALRGRSPRIQSQRRTVHERQVYAALASEYQNAVRRGAGAIEAQVSVFRQYRTVRAFTGSDLSVCANAWFDLCQQLDLGTIALVRCRRCGGHDLVPRGHTDGKRCIWCNEADALHAPETAGQARLAGF